NDNKYYFIQDYENWFVTDKFVKETYHYQMHKIVISNWLKKIVEDCGEKANLVLNGFDFRFFHLLKPISERRNKEVLCLYHTDKRKGLDVAFKAFEIVKRKYSQLHVSMFGTSREPEGLPTWYSYYQEPNKDIFNYIYNNAAIFVGSSNIEGWGLTVGEAMQCGCAVACTNNLGYLEMAKNGDTALVSPVGNAEALAENILKLIEDKELRIKIATNGNQFIKTLDIEKSYKKFKNILAVDSDGCFSDYCDV
ncbi:glycosyltransferase family 4 protein, partial [Hoylesella oralis]|uniref:glycosyltransferase family 4 protein n=1 Tax=Hoylesella oralis TaxID=28134 RepID=UPI003617D505